MAQRLSEISTPALILDRSALQRNVDHMSGRMREAGVDLRPHMKTAKCAEIASMATAGHSGGITVSTLREAEYFNERGFRDILYAVAVTPDKIPRAAALQDRAATLHLLVDDPNIVKDLDQGAQELNARFSMYIDIDTGYHRSGVDPGSEVLIDIGKALQQANNLELTGVLTHAGHSYAADGVEGIKEVAEKERRGTLRAAKRLREAGIACPVVSVGATPTAALGEGFDGVTEARPGNYMFYDLFMYGKGVCALEDIAVSVLTTVIVNRPEIPRVLVDAGGLALSKDKMAAEGPLPGVGYGLLREMTNGPLDVDTVVASVSQEHGWLGPWEAHASLPLRDFPIGSRFRVLPNHSCITCAAYEEYYVVDGSDEIIDVWPRVNGW